MILLTILAIILVMLIATAVIVLGIGGGAFMIIFADLFVCILVVGWLIKRLFKKRK